MFAVRHVDVLSEGRQRPTHRPAVVGTDQGRNQKSNDLGFVFIYDN